VLDSTITGNSAPAGGVAGIEVVGSLTLADSIVYGDLGGAETGGSLTASFSDVCAPGPIGPVAGEGNVCRTPGLVGEGVAGSVDVHELRGSPMQEAGSNALVPTGLTSDFYGQRRIAGGSLVQTCREGLVPVAAPTVDIGAAELSEARVLALEVECPVFGRSSFVFPSVSMRPQGVVVLTFHGMAPGTVIARVRFPLTITTVRRVGGRLVRVRSTSKTTYAEASRVGGARTTLQLTLRPGRRMLRLLRDSHRLRASLEVTFAAEHLFKTSQTRPVTVRYIRPVAPRRRG
jgi:hypothetical protein